MKRGLILGALFLGIFLIMIGGVFGGTCTGDNPIGVEQVLWGTDIKNCEEKWGDPPSEAVEEIALEEKTCQRENIFKITAFEDVFRHYSGFLYVKDPIPSYYIGCYIDTERDKDSASCRFKTRIYSLEMDEEGEYNSIEEKLGHNSPLNEIESDEGARDLSCVNSKEYIEENTVNSDGWNYNVIYDELTKNLDPEDKPSKQKEAAIPPGIYYIDMLAILYGDDATPWGRSKEEYGNYRIHFGWENSRDEWRLAWDDPAGVLSHTEYTYGVRTGDVKDFIISGDDLSEDKLDDYFGAGWGENFLKCIDDQNELSSPYNIYWKDGYDNTAGACCDEETDCAYNSVCYDDGDVVINQKNPLECHGGKIIQKNTWYKDEDGDGYGAGEPQVDYVNTKSGWSLIKGDCDDSDSSINPDATEICDGIDNDCDGLKDEGNLCGSGNVCIEGVCEKINCTAPSSGAPSCGIIPSSESPANYICKEVYSFDSPDGFCEIGYKGGGPYFCEEEYHIDCNKYSTNQGLCEEYGCVWGTPEEPEEPPEGAYWATYNSYSDTFTSRKEKYKIDTEIEPLYLVLKNVSANTEYEIEIWENDSNNKDDEIDTGSITITTDANGDGNYLWSPTQDNIDEGWEDCLVKTFCNKDDSPLSSFYFVAKNETENYTSPDLTIEGDKSTCAITNATWSKSSIYQGQSVKMFVNTTDGCNGKNLTFELSPNNNYQGNFPYGEEIKVQNEQANMTWETKSDRDAGDNYIFTVEVVDLDDVSESSDKLEIKESTSYNYQYCKEIKTEDECNVIGEGEDQINPEMAKRSNEIKGEVDCSEEDVICECIWADNENCTASYRIIDPDDPNNEDGWGRCIFTETQEGTCENPPAIVNVTAEWTGKAEKDSNCENSSYEIPCLAQIQLPLESWASIILSVIFVGLIYFLLLREPPKKKKRSKKRK